MAKPEKIVVVRYRFIGDTLLTIPFLRALRQLKPDAEIHLLVGEDAYDLMRHCPDIDQAIAFEPRKHGFWPSVQRIRQEGYTHAYLLKRSFSSAFMVWLAGIPNRIGFNTDHRRLLLTKAIAYTPTQQHEAQCFLDLLPGYPQGALDLSIESWIPEEVETKILSQFNLSAPQKVLVHVTSTNAAKCWPLDAFKTLIQTLLACEDTHLYFLGVEAEKALYENLKASFSNDEQSMMHNLCGQTTLLESLAVVKHMDLVVANDSGMIHMAAAMNTPVVAIFGPSDPKQWHPLSKRYTIVHHPQMACRPCRLNITCHHEYPCLSEITPEQVLRACKTYLKS